MADGVWTGLDRLADLAGALAGAWAARARASNTLARERALLRLFGVHGLDLDGEPLAATVVDRYVGGDRRRLAAGVSLPFAMALLVYETTPQELAVDVASGAVDLALEGELLADPERRVAAETEARRLVREAVQRIDANRTARRELIDLFGNAEMPWIGATLHAPTLIEGRDEADLLVTGGADVIRVRVPASRELADRLHDLGAEPPEWPGHRFASRPPIVPEAEDPPAGSQRGLAALRQVVDEAAAERRSYARIATVARALAAPEQALVAAFERVDLIEADPLGEIVDDRVDPDRALADHAFAHRLAHRSGCQILVGPGPLVVGPDLARGVPSDPATRAGRALALQAIGVALARCDGVADKRLLLGALPTWIPDERDPATQAIAQVAIQAELFPNILLAFEEPEPSPSNTSRWAATLAAAFLIAPGRAGLVMRRADPATMPALTDLTRTTAEAASEVSRSIADRGLVGPAREHAEAVIAAARVTLERLADLGWSAILGETLRPVGGGSSTRLGADSVVERSDPFDPLDVLDPLR